MSIENSLKRIADALELLAAQGTTPEPEAPATPEPEVPKAPAPVVAPASPESTAPSTPVPPATAPTPPAASAAAPVAESPTAPAPMTVEELNVALVAEHTRLKGNRAAIMGEMAKFNASSVNGLTADQYQPLLDAVRALT